MNSHGGYRAVVVSDENGVHAVYLIPVETAESPKGSDEYSLVEQEATACGVTVNNCIPVVMQTYPVLALELAKAFGSDGTDD